MEHQNWGTLICTSLISGHPLTLYPLHTALGPIVRTGNIVLWVQYIHV